MVVSCIVLVIIATNDPSNDSKSAYFVMIIPDTGYNRGIVVYRLSSIKNRELPERVDVQT